MPSGLGADPTKKQMHSRSSSGQRLVARNAATIKEHDNEEEEELLDGPKAKKESLADMFATEPKEKKRSSTGSAKRVVPAVVLGSPPPQETSTLTANDDSIGRKTKRNDLLVTTVPQPDSVRAKPTATATTAKPRGRSEAQELADFFSSTEPPPDNRAQSSPVPEEPPKSAKSFKSFMSRMTGKKVSKENERPPMPSAFQLQGQGAAGVKRQKSFGSFKSNPASPPLATSTAVASPPMITSASFNSPQQVSSPPDRGVSSSASPPTTSLPERTSSFTTTQPSSSSPRDRGVPSSNSSTQHPSYSNDGGALRAAGDAARSGETLGPSEYLAIGVAAMTMGANAQTRVVSPEQRMDEVAWEKSADNAQSKDGREREKVAGSASMNPNSVGADATAGRIPPTPETKPPRPPRFIGTSQRSIRPVGKDQAPALAPPLSTNADEYVVVDKSDAMPTPIDTKSTREDGNASPIRQTPSTAAQSHFASDAVSFRTASEGTSPPQQDPVVEESGLGKTRAGTLATPESKQVNNSPSIPLSDLVPLRGLLQHATSARECQLLLGAILSQLGIPHSPFSQDEVIDPESRVTAWLLAGREGPVDYSSAQSPRSTIGTDATMTTAATTMASQTTATPTSTDADVDHGKLVSNEQGETDYDLGNGQARDTAIDEVIESNVEDECEVGEGWSGAVRIPGDVESSRIRDEVVGA